VGKVREAHDLGVGQRMVARERQVHRLGQKQRALDVALFSLGREHRVVKDDRQVNLRRAQPRHRLLGLGLSHAQSHAGMTGPELRQGLR
jgi:hypothetical protein